MADRSKLARARRSFLGEPEPGQYFSSPSGTSPWVSPSKQLSNQESLADLRAYQDERDTKMAGNAFNRDRYASERRIIPFSEAADIATARDRKMTSERSMAADPFIREQTERASRMSRQQEEAAIEDFPERRAYDKARIQSESERLQSYDRNEDDLEKLTKSPQSILAYREFLKSADPKMDKQKQRDWAYSNALRLAQDRDAVESVYEAYSNGLIDKDALPKYIEPVDTADGTHLGMRIRNEPGVREQIAKHIADNRTAKFRAQQQRAEFLQTRAHDAQLANILNNRIVDLAKQVRDVPTDKDAAAELSEARRQLGLLYKRLSAAEAENPGGTNDRVDSVTQQ